jgi:acyl-coenzyme A thioesterase PaaI-like protein
MQMVRSLPFGPAVGIARVRHSGRVVTTIEVELFDAREKLAAVGLVTSVLPPPFELRKEPSPWDLDTSAELSRIGDVLELDPGRIVATNVPGSITGDAANCVEMKAPWEDTATTGPELACLVADTVNGAPLWHGQSTLGVAVFPNTDLTLRFASPTGADPVFATGRLVAVEQGTTTVAIDVQAGGHWLAHGHSTSVLIPTPDTATPE